MLCSYNKNTVYPVMTLPSNSGVRGSSTTQVMLDMNVCRHRCFLSVCATPTVHFVGQTCSRSSSSAKFNERSHKNHNVEHYDPVLPEEEFLVQCRQSCMSKTLMHTSVGLSGNQQSTDSHTLHLFIINFSLL